MNSSDLTYEWGLKCTKRNHKLETPTHTSAHARIHTPHINWVITSRSNFGTNRLWAYLQMHSTISSLLHLSFAVEQGWCLVGERGICPLMKTPNFQKCFSKSHIFKFSSTKSKSYKRFLKNKTQLFERSPKRTKFFRLPRRKTLLSQSFCQSVAFAVASCYWPLCRGACPFRMANPGATPAASIQIMNTCHHYWKNANPSTLIMSLANLSETYIRMQSLAWSRINPLVLMMFSFLH